MKSFLQPYILRPVMQVFCLLLLIPVLAAAECREFKIVEFEDRVEAVCVGEPLTEAEKKANQEEERRQNAAAQRQRAEEQQRQRVIEEADRAKAAVKAAEERKKPAVSTVAPQKPASKSTINSIKF